MKTTNNLKKISVTAMLCAVAYICMFVFNFKIGDFLTFDLKDSVLTIIAFLYGPIYAAISSVLVATIEALSVSSTGVYGFIMNALSSMAFSVTCGIIYKYRRTLSGAIIGCVAAVLIMTSVMLAANIFITPHYMGAERSEVMAMIPILFLPFNLVKGVVNAALTMIIYKPVTYALKKSKLVVSSTPQKTDFKKFIPLAIIALAIIIIAIAIIFFALDGDFDIIRQNNS